MGAGPIPVRDLPDPDQGHPCDGRRLSLSRGRGLPLAIAAQGLRPVADRARLLGPLPPRRRLGGRRRPPDPGGPGAARQGPGAVDRDRGFAERHLGAAERRARGGRQQEGQGHQAPPPDLLVRLRPRRPGLRREPPRHARPGTLARAGGRGRVGPAADQGRRDLHRPGGPGGGRPARRRRPGLAPQPHRPRLRALAGPVADRGHVRHAHQPLPPPDQEPRAERRSGRERGRAGQSQACPACLDPPRSKSRLMKQALKYILTATWDSGATSKSIGSLKAGAPGASVTARLPPNVTPRSVSGWMAPPSPARATWIESITTGTDPNSFESRSRSLSPPTLRRATSRTV